MLYWYEPNQPKRHTNQLGFVVPSLTNPKSMQIDWALLFQT
jgi:hypothetical protein